MSNLKLEAGDIVGFCDGGIVARLVQWVTKRGERPARVNRLGIIAESPCTGGDAKFLIWGGLFPRYVSVSNIEVLAGMGAKYLYKPTSLPAKRRLQIGYTAFLEVTHPSVHLGAIYSISSIVLVGLDLILSKFTGKYGRIFRKFINENISTLISAGIAAWAFWHEDLCFGADYSWITPDIVDNFAQNSEHYEVHII